MTADHNERSFSLEPLSVLGCSSLNLVEIAAASGYSHVGFILQSPAPSMAADAVLTDMVLREEVRSALQRTGVRLLNIECFNLTPEADLISFGRALECGYQLGARTGTAIISENSDRADALESYRRLCDMAAEFDMSINLEFLSTCRSMRSIGDAVAFVRDSGRTNAAIMFDLLHVMRLGVKLDDIASLPSELIGGVQLCDGPPTIDESKARIESGSHRLYPGEGVFPVAAFIRLMPPSMVIGLEMPRAADLAKLTPIGHARKMIETARAAVQL